MLRFEHDEKENKCVMEASGSAKEITADAILLVKILYEQFRKDGGDGVHEIFKQVFKEAIKDDLPFMDSDELDKMATEAKEHADNAKKEADEAIERLKNLMGKVLEDILCD